MKKPNNYFKSIYIMLITFITIDFAYGYIDPGTGSMILQMLLAGIFTSLFFIKNIIAKIKLFLKNKFSSKSKQK